MSIRTATIVKLLPRPPTIGRRLPGKLSFFALALPPSRLIERPEPILNSIREHLREEQNSKTAVVAWQEFNLVPWPDAELIGDSPGDRDLQVARDFGHTSILARIHPSTKAAVILSQNLYVTPIATTGYTV